MNWIKRTPEAIGILRQIAMDVVTRINFVSMDVPKSKGRPKANTEQNNENKAYEFSRKLLLKQQLRSCVIEMLALGDCYLWMGSLNSDDAKEIVRKNLKKFGMEFKETDMRTYFNEDYSKRTLQYVPASTMFIEVDDTGTKVGRYVQRTGSMPGKDTFATGRFPNQEVGGHPEARSWTPDKIIQIPLMVMDGKVHGYTPFQSSFPVMKTLGAIKDYHGHFFENGIIPDMFNFEEMSANDTEYYEMEQIIQDWYQNKKRAPLLTTSKVNVQQINKWNKDMEFRMLAIYYTGVIAFSIGMPLEKIRAILGGEINSTTGASDIGSSDYLNNCMDMQDDLETHLNMRFFNEEYKVNMQFERRSVRDQQSEAMVAELKVNILEKIRNMDIIKQDKMPSLVAEYFPEIPEEWINKNPKPMSMQQQNKPSGTAPNLPLPRARQAYADKKKDEQQPQNRIKPPTGFKEIFEVDYSRFVEEAVQAGISEDSRNKIELDESGENVVMHLNLIGIDKVYRATVPKSEFTAAKRMFLSNLSKKGTLIKETMFEVDFARFQEEVVLYGVKPDSRNKIELEEAEKEIRLYYCIIGLDKTYMTRMSPSEFTDLRKLFILPLSKKATRVKDSLFEIDFKRFQEEVADQNIKDGDRNKVEVEDEGESVSLYLSPVGISKTYKTTLPKDQKDKILLLFINNKKKSKRVR